MFDLFHQNPQSITLELWRINRLKSNRFSFLHQNLDCINVQSSKNWLWWWPNLISKLDILCSYRFGFSHQRYSRSPYSCRGGFDWEVFAFDSCIKSLILRKRSGVFFLNHLDTAKHVLPWVQARFFPSMSQSEVFNFLQTIRLKKCRNSSLLLMPDGPKIPKSAVTFDLSRCSNSFSPTLRFGLFHHVPNRSLWSRDKSVE